MLAMARCLPSGLKAIPVRKALWPVSVSHFTSLDQPSIATNEFAAEWGKHVETC